MFLCFLTLFLLSLLQMSSRKRGLSPNREDREAKRVAVSSSSSSSSSSETAPASSPSGNSSSSSQRLRVALDEALFRGAIPIADLVAIVAGYADGTPRILGIARPLVPIRANVHGHEDDYLLSYMACDQYRVVVALESQKSTKPKWVVEVGTSFETPRKPLKLKSVARVTATALSESQVFVGFSSKQVHGYDLATGKLVVKMKPLGSPAQSMTYDPVSREVFLSLPNDNSVVRWSPTLSYVSEFVPAGRIATHIAIHGDSLFLAVPSSSSLWSANDQVVAGISELSIRQPYPPLTSVWTTAVFFSPRCVVANERYVAWASVRVYNSGTSEDFVYIHDRQTHATTPCIGATWRSEFLGFHRGLLYVSAADLLCVHPFA